VVKELSGSGVKLEQTAQSVATVNGHAQRPYISEDAVLSYKILVLEQELLIDAGDVGQPASPFAVCHEEHPS
jgi:hypothetical protein